MTKSVVTHNGVFHADEVLASVILKLAGELTDYAQVTRTRNPTVINSADIVYDVGGEYDAERRRFDHHQKGAKGPEGTCWCPQGKHTRSSAGLIWEKYRDLVAPSKEVQETLRKQVIAKIDQVDNGESPVKAWETWDMSQVIASFNPPWDGDGDGDVDQDVAFMAACQTMETLFKNAISRAESLDRARTKVLEAPVLSGVLLLGDFCPWQEHITDHPRDQEILMVVFRDRPDSFRVYQVPKEPGSTEGRVPLPKEWAGLREEELRKVSLIPTATFVHNGRFCGGATTLEGAVSMARGAIDLAQ